MYIHTHIDWAVNRTVSGRFRSREVSGRFRDGFGCPRPNFRRRKTKDLCATCESIWASDLQHGKLLARASGHQSSKIPP